MRAAALISTLALSSPAFADAADDEIKNPMQATALAAGGAAVGLVGIYMGANMRDGGDTPIMLVGALATVIAPSAGAWYADGYRFTPGLGMRIGGALIMGFGFASAVDRACDPVTGCQGPLRDAQSDTMIQVGAAVVVGGIIYDIATAGSYARDHNERRAAITPVVTPTQNGTTFGVAFGF